MASDLKASKVSAVDEPRFALPLRLVPPAKKFCSFLRPLLLYPSIRAAWAPLFSSRKLRLRV
jgi:hypothetical protein